MRHLTLKNKAHRTVEEDFKTWLATLSYNKFSIEYSPIYVREFLYWLENHERTIEKITEATIPEYFDNYLSKRGNQRRGGGLSNDYLNGHLTSIKQFSEYLQQTSGHGFVILKDYYPRTTRETVLTRQQIEAMYEACGNDSAKALRNRAILALYYGCGLRRNEGVHVNIEDVLFNRKLLHVRQGKQYRERYVPLARHVQEDLKNYLEIARPTFRDHDKTPALLLGIRGRITGCTTLGLIKKLGAEANITTDFGLHTLRHSIATHLLHAGMKLEQVSSFLGHESLESTQRYTHLVEQLSLH
jgi:integrase/recombinase XerD